MSSVPSQFRLQVPATLKTQLLDFRRKVSPENGRSREHRHLLHRGRVPRRVRRRSIDEHTGMAASLGAVCGDCRLHGRSIYLYRWIWRHRQLKISRGC